MYNLPFPSHNPVSTWRLKDLHLFPLLFTRVHPTPTHLVIAKTSSTEPSKMFIMLLLHVHFWFMTMILDHSLETVANKRSYISCFPLNRLRWKASFEIGVLCNIAVGKYLLPLSSSISIYIYFPIFLFVPHWAHSFPFKHVLFQEIV